MLQQIYGKDFRYIASRKIELRKKLKYNLLIFPGIVNKLGFLNSSFPCRCHVGQNRRFRPTRQICRSCDPRYKRPAKHAKRREKLKGRTLRVLSRVSRAINPMADARAATGCGFYALGDFHDLPD